MTREEIIQFAANNHDARMDRACQKITDTDSPEDARLMLETAVRMHPGVSMDPDTVPDILRLMDTYISRLFVSDTPDTVTVRTDRCWRAYPHGPHTWLSEGLSHQCQGNVRAF
jgi:hypothetical protein